MLNKLNKLVTTIGLISLLFFSLSQFFVTSVISQRFLNISFALWLFTILITKRGQYILSSQRYRWFYAFLIMIFLFTSVEQSVFKAIISIMVLCQTASPILMFDYYKVFKPKVKTFVIGSCLLFLCFDCYTSLSIFELTGGMGLRGIRETDIIFYNAYNIVYSLACLIPLFFYIFFQYRNRVGLRVLRLLLLIMAMFFVYIVYRSYFITALIITLLTSVIGVFYGRKKWLLYSAITIFTSAMIFISSYSLIVSKIENNSAESTDVITERLGEIYDVITGNRHYATDFNQRQELRAMSWRTFLDNPLYGVYPKSASFMDAEANGVGHHSEWTDLLAMYGVLSIILFAFLIKSVISIRKDVGGYVYIFPYVAIGFYNPVFVFNQNFTAFFIAPLLLTCLSQNK